MKKLLTIALTLFLLISFPIISDSNNKGILIEPTVIDLNANKPFDPFAGFQWFLYKANFDEVWDYPVATKKPIIIGVIDTGVQIDHLDLRNNLLNNGYNSVYETNDATYTTNHGTLVSGVIFAETHNRLHASGVTGHYPIKLLPINASFDEINGNMWDSDIAKSIKYCIENDVDIINMSFGTYEESATLKYWVNRALEEGIIIVASSGNSGNEEYFYPASYDGVISVGSVNKNLSLSSFSTYNDKLDLVAGGDMIFTLDVNNDSSYANGTSLSAPFVTGLIGIMKVINPELTNDKIKEILFDTALDLGEEGYDKMYGHGLINPKDAVEKSYEEYIEE